jgi:hypothetical protein
MLGIVRHCDGVDKGYFGKVVKRKEGEVIDRSMGRFGQWKGAEEERGQKKRFVVEVLST